MATVRSFLRHTSGEALRAYFGKRDLTLPDDFHWSQKHPALVKALITSIDKMNDVDRGRVTSEIERMSEMAGDYGQIALANIMQGRPEFEQVQGAHDRAVWVFVNRPQDFSHAEEGLYVDERRRKKKMWDGYVALPGIVVKRDEPSLEIFRQSIRDRFKCQRVRVEIFDRFRQTFEGERLSLVQITIHREGELVDELALEKVDDLVRRSRRPVLEAALTYEPDSGVIEIVANDTDTRVDLLRVATRDLMGIDLKTDKLPFKKYNLDVLLKPCDLSYRRR